MIGIFILLIIAMVIVIKYCKKSLKIILSTIIILIVLYCTVISIDMNRVNTFREPIFAITSEKNDYEFYSQTVYKGLGYIVKINYIQNNEIEKITMCFMGNTITEAIAKNNHIKKRSELETRKLFDLGDGISNNETDLMSNDMTWNQNCRLYYRIITNMADYQKYKSRIDVLPDITDENFEDIFVVVVANENVRDESETDLIIYDVVSDESATHIIMKQKENSNIDSNNNVFYAIVDKSELKKNADITIEK